MRIVIVGPAYPLRGGIAQYLAVLYKRLQAAGHEVKFVSFTKQFPEWLFPGKTQLEESKDVIDVEPVARFAPLEPLSWGRTAKEIAAFEPDLVLFKWWMPFFGLGYWATARKVRRLTNARILFIIDNAIPHERRPGDKFLTKLAFSQVDFYVAQSRAVERDLFTWFPNLPREKVTFCPHPIYDCYPAFDGETDKARAELGMPAGAKVLLFFGFVRAYKGLHLLLDAMPEIRKQYPEVILQVVGEFYDVRESYDQKIRELGLEDCVRIRDDYVPNEEVGIYFQAADCVVLPYKSATQSGIIQIAYALEMPVITTDVGGLQEVVEDGVTGYVVPPEQPAALTEAITKFYERGGRNAFIESVQQASRKFSWEGLIESITGFLKKESS